MSNGYESKEDVIKDINSAWNEKISGKKYPDMWYVAVTATFPIDEYPD